MTTVIGALLMSQSSAGGIIGWSFTGPLLPSFSPPPLPPPTTHHRSVATSTASASASANKCYDSLILSSAVRNSVRLSTRLRKTAWARTGELASIYLALRLAAAAAAAVAGWAQFVAIEAMVSTDSSSVLRVPPVQCARPQYWCRCWSCCFSSSDRWALWQHKIPVCVP